MTPERIAELRALTEKATPGPWTLSGKPHPPLGGEEWTCEPGVWREGSDYDDYGSHPDEDDAAFIVAARTALPEALDAIERVGRLLDWHYHNSGTDLISSTDVYCALSGERPLYERNMTPGLRAALEGKSE